MKYCLFDDVQLWNLIAEGDQEAFAFVYTAYSGEMFKYGHKFTLDIELLEDVIQDVFVNIWESRNNLIIQKSIKFYLLSSFRREIIKRVNSLQKSESLEDYHSNLIWQASFQEILLENQISLESSERITHAIDSLSARQKEAIFLRYIQDFSYEEISTMMGIQVPSLYNLIFKGIRAMKAFLVSSNFTDKSLILMCLLLFY